MTGKYEREEAVPSIDAAKKIADAFEVSLGYLVGKVLTPRLTNALYNAYRKLRT